MKPFTVVSTFAGCGGSSLGYKLAGGKVLLAVEWDQNAVDTYRANHPGTDVYHGDIAELSVEEALARTGLAPGELDVLDGSPPCQGFSTAGKRRQDDDRNQLFREFVRLLRGLRPRAFVMENVAGMVKGRMKLIFAEVLRELKGSGYRVRARLLEAQDYGVPQRRPRLIFIGARDDLGIEPSHPPITGRRVTVREALAGCVSDPDELAFLIDAGKRYRGYDAWPLLKQGEGCSDLGMVKHFSGAVASMDRPAPTICASVANVSVAQLMHPTERRRFTTAELKRLSSFPDDFIFPGGYQAAAKRIGNTVPPKLMQAIAEHVQRTIIEPAHARTSP